MGPRLRLFREAVRWSLLFVPPAVESGRLTRR
jgi:hypothetical protein